jgi:hypothetical protein
MSKRPFIAILVTLSCLAYVGFADAFTLRSDEGHFAAEFPREPTRDDIVAKYHSDGTREKIGSWRVDNGDYLYSLEVNIYDTAIDFDYDDVTNYIVKSVKGKLIGQKPFQLQSITGRDFSVEAGDRVHRARLLIVDRHRLYRIVYAGPRGTENSRDAEAFLNSFRLQN